MLLINSKTNTFFTWSAEFIMVTKTVVNQEPKSAITDTKLYVSNVTLSVQDNAKLLQQLKTDFRGTINQNNYQSKPNYRQEINIYIT